jgi:Nuclease A inhibitor-like protein
MNNPSPKSISPNEHSVNLTTLEVLDLLKQATIDLLWSSESDYPFEIVTWEPGIEMTTATLFSNLDQADLAIESIDLTNFFEPVLIVEDWYEAEELAQVDRYTNLLQTIDSNLTEVKVFRIGEIEIDIYIVGKTPSGDIVGLKTQVVET